MHFIECTYCKFRNSLKSEYEIFCEQCGKKLENNYQDWKIRHADETIEDYYRLVCVQEPSVPIAQPATPRRRNYLLPVISLSLIVLLIIFYFGCRHVIRKLAPYLQNIQATSITENSKWERRSCGTSGLSIESPLMLMKTPMNLPENVEALIDTMQTYACFTSGGFSILTNAIRYISTIPANLTGAAKGSVLEMQNKPGISDFRYGHKKFDIDNKDGILVEGNYLLITNPMGFKNAIFVENNRLWQVTVIYHVSDSLETKAAGRIIESIQIR